jgi:hypothetical protein
MRAIATDDAAPMETEQRRRNCEWSLSSSYFNTTTMLRAASTLPSPS